MTKVQFSDLLRDLAADPGFRKTFADSPAKALRARGFDPDLLALPERIDLAALERRLAAMQAGREIPRVKPGEKIDDLKPQDAWDRFLMIGLKEGLAASTTVNATANLTAVVIYGSSAATSTSTTSTTTTTAAAGRVAGPLSPGELNRLTLLREIARADPAGLTFTVRGPDGTVVDGLDVNATRALLGRLK
ncbi:hypothetical protein [Polymorphum gilvum]|uniref:Uncharacterized protein n=1 Tax=Polymorphum gilvum (strain LMG 25793 / CGMCC 1.9160 / SL003B-26A1) TaxID=991905 RepID=F2IY35_POLGS|nr:hypothetical protein [Polymorphum gilvum]ADZ70538.1 hypothetical protein SL003B_2113 [Polymorphum gilvum SL003B-26A1]